MEALKDTKPFNLEHAKAGAPYACRNGTDATIVKFDGRCSGLPLVGYFSAFDVPTGWSADGSHTDPGSSLVMIPLGYIDGKPVFVGDELHFKTFKPAFGVVRAVEPKDRHFAECRWPKPKQQYPETRMTYEELCADGDIPLISMGGYSIRAIANAAIRHAIDEGQVVTADHFAELLKERDAFVLNRAARDMAIAEAVRAACMADVDRNHSRAARELLGLDLSAIIAEVKA